MRLEVSIMVDSPVPRAACPSTVAGGLRSPRPAWAGEELPLRAGRQEQGRGSADVRTGQGRSARAGSASTAWTVTVSGCVLGGFLRYPKGISRNSFDMFGKV